MTRSVRDDDRQPMDEPIDVPTVTRIVDGKPVTLRQPIELRIASPGENASGYWRPALRQLDFRGSASEMTRDDA